MSDEAITLLKGYIEGTEKMVEFGNRVMTLIIKRSGHIRSIPMSVLKLALDLEIKYIIFISGSEFQKQGANMIEMASNYQRTRTLE